MGELAKSFDYNQIEDKDVRGKLVYFEGQIKKSLGVASKEIFEAGTMLNQAHATLANHKTGTFRKWIEGTLPIAKSTAYRWMAVAEVYEKYCPTLGQYDPTALYKLSSDKCPEAATREAQRLAEKGERITGPVAGKLIKKHTVDAVKVEKPKPPALSQYAENTIKKKKLAISDEQREGLAQYTAESQAELLDSVLAGLQTLDQAIESGEVPQETAEEQIERINGLIESHCRQLKKFFTEQCPDDPWLVDGGLKDNALADLDRCCKQLRLAKCKHVCPECEGAGCKHCKQTGRMPDFQYKQMS